MYDQYGREKSATEAAGSFTFAFDAEGRPTLIQGTQSIQNGPGLYSLQSSYTSRDELLAFGAETYANGLGISTHTSVSGSTDPPASTMFDTANSAPLNIMPPTRTCNSLCIDPPPTVFSYDAAMRQTTQITNTENTEMIQRNYDSDNHTVSEQFQNIPASSECQTGAIAYTWGQFEHPYVVGASAVYSPAKTCGSPYSPPPAGNDILHWNGDSLLFTNGVNLDDIKIDDDADITLVASNTSLHSVSGPYSGSAPLVTFWDRGLDGTIVGCHNQGGYGPGPVFNITLNSAYVPTSPGCSTSNTSVKSEPPLVMPDLFEVGSGGVLYKPKSDGYFDGYNTLQGVRMMDSVTGNFTTPDAFVGEIADPATKKPFIWNLNNPQVYSDPSGFNSLEDEAEAESSSVAKMSRIQTYQSNSREFFRNLLKVPNNAPKFPTDSNKLNHIFNERPGHVPDSDLNRAMMQKTASDEKNFAGTVANGTVRVYRLQTINGAQVWVEVRSGVINNAGINKPGANK